MDLFRKAGETFEETKQAIVDGNGSRYICRTCEKEVAKDYEYCPHCGEKTVEPSA